MHETLDAIFAKAPTPMALLDRDFMLVRVNLAYAATVGEKMQYLTGRYYLDTIPHNDSTANTEILASLQRVKETGEIHCDTRTPLVYANPLGTDLSYWRWTLTPMRDADSQVHDILLTLEDVTDRVRADKQLRESRHLLQQIVDAIPLRICWKDLESRYLGCNALALVDTGLPQPEHLIGKTDSELNWSWKRQPDEREALDPTDFASEVEEHIETQDGRQRWVRRSQRLLTDPDGQPMGTLGIQDDITERKEADHKLMMAYAAINKSDNGFYWLSPRGQVIDVNEAAASSLGYSREELIGLHIWDFDPDFSPDSNEAAWEEIRRHGAVTLESRHRRKDGSIFPIEARANHVTLGSFEYTFTFVQDISDRKTAEEQIRNLAFFDALTQLPNRRLLMDRIEQALAASARSGVHGAIMFLDLDNFKALNDTQGHDMGDLLLIEVAERLRATVRAADTVARLGGDEFVIMLPSLSDDVEEAESLATAIADKALEAINRPYRLRHYEHNSSGSIGISLFNGGEDRMDELLSRADAAMYEAKKAGRNTFRFFDPAIQQTLETRARLESLIRQAVPEREFRLHYQIQVDHQLRPIGTEALIRWLHPREGLIHPENFIPVAEETGLMLPIGQWIIEEAVTQMRRWTENPMTRGLTVAVNLSAREFHQPNFVTRMNQVIQESGIDPSRLRLELTERIVLVDIADTIDKMRRMQHLGVSFALDDFGTGHSSLSYLKRLPLDQLKIDHSFIRDITIDPNDAALIQAIIGIGKNLGLQVIAEGVETQEQLALLHSYGCEAFQGYLFGKPEPAALVERRLGESRRSGIVADGMPG